MEAFLNAAVEKVHGLNSVAVTTESGQLLMCTDGHPAASSSAAAAAGASAMEGTGVGAAVGMGASANDAASNSSGDNASALMYFASSQLSKIKTGSVRSVTASYRTGGTFIQVNALPLIVTFYGSDDMDAAFVRGLAPDVIDALRPLRESIAAAHQG